MNLVYTATCLDCDWTATGKDADREADKHTRKEKHSTVSAMEPEKTDE